MKKVLFIALLCSLFVVACSQKEENCKFVGGPSYEAAAECDYFSEMLDSIPASEIQKSFLDSLGGLDLYEIEDFIYNDEYKYYYIECCIDSILYYVYVPQNMEDQFYHLWKSLDSSIYHQKMSISEAREILLENTTLWQLEDEYFITVK